MSSNYPEKGGGSEKDDNQKQQDTGKFVLPKWYKENIENIEKQRQREADEISLPGMRARIKFSLEKPEMSSADVPIIIDYNLKPGSVQDYFKVLPDQKAGSKEESVAEKFDELPPGERKKIAIEKAIVIFKKIYDPGTYKLDVEQDDLEALFRIFERLVKWEDPECQEFFVSVLQDPDKFRRLVGNINIRIREDTKFFRKVLATGRTRRTGKIAITELKPLKSPASFSPKKPVPDEVIFPQGEEVIVMDKDETGFQIFVNFFFQKFSDEELRDNLFSSSNDNRMKEFFTEFCSAFAGRKEERQFKTHAFLFENQAWNIDKNGKHTYNFHNFIYRIFNKIGEEKIQLLERFVDFLCEPVYANGGKSKHTEAEFRELSYKERCRNKQKIVRYDEELTRRGFLMRDFFFIDGLLPTDDLFKGRIKEVFSYEEVFDFMKKKQQELMGEVVAEEMQMNRTRMIKECVEKRDDKEELFNGINELFHVVIKTILGGDVSIKFFDYINKFVVQTSKENGIKKWSMSFDDFVYLIKKEYKIMKIKEVHIARLTKIIEYDLLQISDKKNFEKSRCNLLDSGLERYTDLSPQFKKEVSRRYLFYIEKLGKIILKRILKQFSMVKDLENISVDDVNDERFLSFVEFYEQCIVKAGMRIKNR